METVAILFVVKMLSLNAVAGPLGYFAKRSWMLIPIAVIVSAFDEVALFATQVTREFNPTMFAISLLASGLWAGAGYSLKRAMGRAEI